MLNKKYKYLIYITIITIMTACGSGSKLVGAPAPEFSLDLLEGGQIGLTDMKGKPVILYFFASW